MDRKSACEQIVLTNSEKRLLRHISKHPHTKCDPEKVRPLYDMDLVRADTEGVDPFNSPVRKDTYCVSELYHIYLAYCSEKRFLLMLKSLWLPVFVSIFTTLAINGLQWSLPLLAEWFASFL